MANLLRYPLPIDRALEVACGTGAYSHSLAQQSALRVTGIDLDSSAIALAKDWYGATPRLEFKVEDANSMGYREEFGLVFCMDSLHHFDSLGRILGACFAALASGGVLYFTDLYREATQGDHSAEEIRKLRQRIPEGEFIKRALHNRIFQSGDLITNLRRVQTANSKLAAYSKKEFAKALEQAGFTDIRSAVSSASAEAPEKVVYGALKP
jgi:2-polyprenyl-3-methyl-5-hydroxy-6-metoxy-1,4-benzoquinol methylase